MTHRDRWLDRTCCCPNPNAYRCREARGDESGERCDCVCHDPDEDDDDEPVLIGPVVDEVVARVKARKRRRTA